MGEIDHKHLHAYLDHLDGKVLLGIDGMIDEVWHMIDTRIDATTYNIMKHMKPFGDMIVERATGGFAKELIKKRRSYGGFTANTAHAITRLNIKTTMMGTYGQKNIDAAFEEFEHNCRMISIADPTLSNILEYSDGKIILAHLENLLHITWDTLIHRIGKEELSNLLAETDIVGLGYWSSIPCFNDILEHLASHPTGGHKPKRFFFDFANITKKSTEALRDTLSLICKLNHTIPMTLSLNEHEGHLMLGYYGRCYAEDPVVLTQELVELRKTVGIDEIIIHTPFFASIATQNEGGIYVLQHHVENPVKTTGAGDSFNGGYISSCFGDLTPAERLMLANAVTRHYVLRGHAPNTKELQEMLLS